MPIISGKYLSFYQDGKTYNLFDIPDGFVVEGDLDIQSFGLAELPDLSRITVKGNFLCQNNNLTSLKGAPQEIGGDFVCDGNKLTSLEGSPQKVNSFYCRNNKLTTLKGAPQEIRGNFSCFNNELTSLEGLPKEIGGNFECSDNRLTSLLGLPKMKDDAMIYCWNLGAKYGIYGREMDGIKYEELAENTKFITEKAVNRVAHKNQQQRKEETAKHKAGFEAFKKKFKPGGREE
jgi:hypothetical protein